MYSYIIIDDETLIRRGTEKKLAALSDQIYCAGTAADGKSGIALIKEKHPDIIILDMQMPVMDGTQLLPYLSGNYPEIPLIVISGYRDFDYVSHAIKAQAVDYILKPFSREDIQKAVKNAIGKLEDAHSYKELLSSEEQAEHNYYQYDIKMLQNLIMGYHTGDISISSKRLSFINDTHDLFLLTLHFSVPVDKADMDIFIEENGFGDLGLYLAHQSEADLGFIVLFIPENSPLSLRKLALQAAEDLEIWMSGHNTVVTLGISNIHHNLSELHNAFLETSSALNSQLLSERGFRCYFYSGQIRQTFIAWDKQDEFLFRIEAGMNDETARLTDELFHYYTTVDGCTLADVKYHCFQLGSQCRLIINNYLSMSSDSENSASMQNVVSRIFSLEELETYYRQFFLNIADMLRPQSVYAIDDTIEKIRIYIDRNYQKNLTQEFISCLFYLNRSYLSHLFKEKTGQKFVDYLNSIRISKAKELLRSSDRKMYQISKAVGYDNVKYFFRIFKKFEGVTPEQYRNSSK